MAKSKRRAPAADKDTARNVVEEPARGKKPKGLAAVGFLKAQGTRSFRKHRGAGS